jgi:hypothetical protein
VNARFVVRGFLIALPATILAILVGLVLIVAQTPVGQPLAPTPFPPTILAPWGDKPAGLVGLEEWARYPDGMRTRGSGFIVVLDSGELVGVTTAHSVSFSDPDEPIDLIALRVAGEDGFVAEFDTLRGPPGHPMEDFCMVMDFVLMHTADPIDPGFVLTPDSRGAPQPGERVWLFSGLGDGRGGRRVLEGTVQSVSDESVWVLMDELFNPSMMSGSPFVSQHTGQVVGMLIAVTPRRNRLLMGVHPIGSIVGLAESATEYIKMDEYGWWVGEH